MVAAVLFFRTFDKSPCVWYNQGTKFKEAFIKKKHIDNAQNGLHYTLRGDVYLPDLAVSGNEHKPLGKYGLMRRTYLREHHKTLYIQLQARGELWQHLYEVDEQAQSMVSSIIARMAEIDGVTEELKATDQMQWVGLMNNYQHCAEEVVLRDVVYA